MIAASCSPEKSNLVSSEHRNLCCDGTVPIHQPAIPASDHSLCLRRGGIDFGVWQFIPALHPSIEILCQSPKQLGERKMWPMHAGPLERLRGRRKRSAGDIPQLRARRGYDRTLAGMTSRPCWNSGSASGDLPGQGGRGKVRTGGEAEDRRVPRPSRPYSHLSRAASP